ncbi:hypothetical protein V1512DRAFT_212862, partial [Lipomyces arxii]|uniref:uncharacterized protein n=1 Tax=Lipomyces arxii TaxID=56418 RepID=UPI0034CF3C29
HIKDALLLGAKLESCEKRPDLDAYFYEPTVISSVTQDTLVAADETFGPLP